MTSFRRAAAAVYLLARLSSSDALLVGRGRSPSPRRCVTLRSGPVSMSPAEKAAAVAAAATVSLDPTGGGYARGPAEGECAVAPLPPLRNRYFLLRHGEATNNIEASAASFLSVPLLRPPGAGVRVYHAATHTRTCVCVSPSATVAAGFPARVHEVCVCVCDAATRTAQRVNPPLHGRSLPRRAPSSRSSRRTRRSAPSRTGSRRSAARRRARPRSR